MSWYLQEPDLSVFLGIEGPEGLRARHMLKKLFFHDYYRIDPNARVTDGKLYKYWKNRNSIFSLIDTGNLYLTDELWYSVTPES